MRIGSLFSGIEGLELGLVAAGVGHVAWSVERDPYCAWRIRSTRSGGVLHEDVRHVGRHNLAPVDVICGGYPCQPYSTSGRRKGTQDHRDLWPEFARIIGEVQPRYVVIENVAGHLTLGFDRTLRDLAALGYDAEWDVLSACALGAAHTRERLFCLAYPSGIGQPEPWEYQQDASDHAQKEHWQADRLVDAVRRGAVPYVCREAHGVPGRVHRVTALGNAVVPQMAKVAGRRLLAIHDALNRVNPITGPLSSISPLSSGTSSGA